MTYNLSVNKDTDNENLEILGKHVKQEGEEEKRQCTYWLPATCGGKRWRESQADAKQKVQEGQLQWENLPNR